MTCDAISGVTSQALEKQSYAKDVFSSLSAARPFSLYSFLFLKEFEKRFEKAGQLLVLEYNS